MINIENFLETLPIVLFGMCGIFIVIAILFIVIQLLCKIFKAKDEK